MAAATMNDPRMKKEMQKQSMNATVENAFPKLDKQKFATLPASPLSGSAMINYLKNLLKTVQGETSAAALSDVQQTSLVVGNNADKLEAAALSAWLTDNSTQALLLSLQACIIKPGDLLMLNNLAAILNLNRKEYQSLPILKTLVSSLPDNAIVLNNIGQAYAGVGALDSAMRYFGRCVQVDPHHPEANNTAGQIEKIRGNKEKAIQYFENSLHGGYNQAAADALSELSATDVLARAHVPHMYLPGYFNDYKYKIPRQCQNIKDGLLVKQEHVDFYNFLHDLIDQYSTLKNDELQKGNLQLKQGVNAAIHNPEAYSNDPSAFVRPFSFSASKILTTISLEIAEKQATVKSFTDNIRKDIKMVFDKYKNDVGILTDQYNEKIASLNCGEGNGQACAEADRLRHELCLKQNELANKCLAAIAEKENDIVEKEKSIAREQFDRTIYYSYMSGQNGHLAKANFYSNVIEYLTAIAQTSQNYFVLNDYCRNDTMPKAKRQTDALANVECPFDLKIPLVVGSLQLSCDKFSFSAGEGVIFKYKKDFKTMQSTISIGAGLDFTARESIPGVKTSAGVSASESLFICFDGNNHITDAGLSIDIGGSAGVTAATGSSVQISKSIESISANAGYTIGINSGWTFNTGTLK
ncbi:MAG: tetratricopeptide repeat protein [Bacteroidia bacterium]